MASKNQEIKDLTHKNKELQKNVQQNTVEKEKYLLNRISLNYNSLLKKVIDLDASLQQEKNKQNNLQEELKTLYKNEKDLVRQIKELKQQNTPKYQEDAFQQVNLQNLLMRAIEPVFQLEQEIEKLDDTYKQQVTEKTKILPISQNLEGELKRFLKHQMKDIHWEVNLVSQKLYEEVNGIQKTIQMLQQQKISQNMIEMSIQPLRQQLNQANQNIKQLDKVKQYIQN